MLPSTLDPQQKPTLPPGSKIYLHDETTPRFGLLESSRNRHSLEMLYARSKEKLHKAFSYPVETVKSATYVPARAYKIVDSERTEASRTLSDRRCPRMSLVHLGIKILLTFAGLSTLQPHVPPAICPYSQEAISRIKHDLLDHACSSISKLLELSWRRRYVLSRQVISLL